MDGWGFGVMQGLLVACCGRPRQGEVIIQGDYVCPSHHQQFFAHCPPLLDSPANRHGREHQHATKQPTNQTLTILVKEEITTCTRSLCANWCPKTQSHRTDIMYTSQLASLGNSIREPLPLVMRAKPCTLHGRLGDFSSLCNGQLEALCSLLEKEERIGRWFSTFSWGTWLMYISDGGSE